MVLLTKPTSIYFEVNHSDFYCLTWQALKLKLTSALYWVPHVRTWAHTTNLRVRFFGKIQNWIIDLRSHGYFAPKETKNPKMDFWHDNAVNTFCTEHKIIGRNLFSVECILGKFTSAYKIFHKNHTTK